MIMLNKKFSLSLSFHCQYSLFDPLQSTYRSGHLTETALVKISNDIVSSLDGGQCVKKKL